ncbi:ATP-grasp domain-containing protein [Streptomyces buecherae]|uniref:ATP-grasp domain-containing protein n=1 Tax=Streptomyces buecherae TaxID=2763006 RepID=UPI0036C0B7DC
MRWICLLGPSPGGSLAVARHGRRLVVLVPPGGAVPGRVTAHADRVVVTDITDHAAVRAAVDALTAEWGPPELVVSFTELAQETSARLATDLGLPSVSPEAAARARDKTEMRRLLADTPYAWPYVGGTAREIAARVAAGGDDTRWVIKPVAGTGSSDVSTVSSLAEAERWLDGAGAGRYIAEHAAEGPEYGVDVVSVDGRHAPFAITAKRSTESPRFVETLHVYPASVSAGDEALLYDAAFAVLDALDVRWGASHTQVRLDPTHGPVVIETHTRLAGDFLPELVELVTGRDLYDVHLAALLGTGPAREGTGTAGAAAIGYVLPPASGTLTDLGVDPTDEVVRWEFHKALGDPVREVRGSDDRIGYAVVLGATAEEAVASVARAVAHVRVRVAPPREPP